MQERKQIVWQVLSPAIIFALSAVWHFLYDWMPIMPVGWVAPVAESVWEHLKIVWYPSLLWWCIFPRTPAKERWTMAVAVATLGGVWMLLYYYLLHAGLGLSVAWLWVDLVAEFLALVTAEISVLVFWRAVGYRSWWFWLALALSAVAVVSMAVLTHYYPDLPVFFRY